MWQSLREYIPSMGRWGWMVMVDVIGSSVGGYLDISNIVSIPMWIWGTLLLAGLIAAPFLAFHKVRIDRDNQKTKLDDILSSAPNLESYGEPYIDTRPIFSVDKIEGQYPVLGKPFFAHAKFCNNPKIRTTEATAQNVIAEISFFDKEYKPILGPIYGRWEGTPQPSTLSPFESRRQLATNGWTPTWGNRERRFYPPSYSSREQTELKMGKEKVS